MKHFFLGLASVLLIACNSAEKAPTTEMAKTPEGLASIQKQQAANSNSSGSASPLLNPEHGMPGHNCELPVGAPLNQAANNQNAAATVTTQSVSSTSPSPTASAAPGKLNPEHGMPGHRCDIAVGAPLSSAAAATSTSPAPVPAPTAKAPNSNAKLNPAHGMPGHDCALPVGAPLS